MSMSKMRSFSTGCFLGFIVFIFIFLFQSHSVVSFSTDRISELSRHRRQTCADGTYEHGNLTCCLCAPGQKLKQHCTNKGRDSGVCELCENGTYNPDPTSKTSCEPCRSCEQPNANLEVEEACTPHRNTECRCKKDYYCHEETEPCKICQPCDTCGSAGVKEPCTRSSNTVCREESKSGGIAAGVIVGLILIAGIVGFIYWIKTRRAQQSTSADDRNTPLIPQVDILPHLPAIAEKLSWKVMKDIATESRIEEAVIESAQLNYPQDSQEWTKQLLREWVERQGKTALPDLIEVLRKKGKNAIADKILEIVN